MAFQLICDGCLENVSTNDDIVRYTIHRIPGTRRQLDLTNLTIIDGASDAQISTLDFCMKCAVKIIGLEHAANVS